MTTPLRATLLLAMCGALAAFCSPTPPDAANVPIGAWGGEHIALEVTGAGATVEFDCAHGTIDETLTLDSSGRFDVAGSLTRESPGPIRGDDPSRAAPARYSGSLEDSTLTVTVVLTESKDTVGVFTLKRGAQPRLFKCK
jgi:hypothetical protein